MAESTTSLSEPYKAIGHGREINLSTLGVPAVLIFVGRETSGQAAPLVTAIRERWGSVAQVQICNLADVRGIPKLLRKPVEMLMKSSYNDAASNLLEGRRPEDYVNILPDWEGQAYRAFGVEDVTKEAAFGVLDGAGGIVGTYKGPDAISQVVSVLVGLVPDGAPG